MPGMSTTGDLRRILKGFVMNPMTPDRVESYEPGYLVVSGEKIEQLTRDDPRPLFPSAEFIDHGTKRILPGFVDTHVHLPQFRIMGVGAGDLLTWLNTYTYPEEARFSSPYYAAEVSGEFFRALVDNNDNRMRVFVGSRTGNACRILCREGDRTASLYREGDDGPQLARSVSRTPKSRSPSLRLCEEWDGAEGGRLRYVFTPRYAGSCSVELMTRVGHLADRGVFVQTHLSENKDEVSWVRQLFPSTGLLAVYDSAGLLGERSIMAHCIHLSSDEIALLSRTRTNVAFCPYSNRTLRSGTMPYKALRDAGLSVSLGTDVAGGPSLSMLDQMQQAIAAAAIPWSETLYLATLGGANALGLDREIGNFEAGKDADFIVLDGNSVQEVYIRGKLCSGGV